MGRNPDKAKTYHTAHREADNARSAAYYAAHREELKARSARWYAAHREEKKAYDAVYRVAHREERLAQCAVYRMDHREKLKSYDAAHNIAHRKEKKAYDAARRAAYPEKALVNNQRSRSRKAALPATLTRGEWEAIKAAYRHKCAYCGKKVVRLTQDHVIPLSKGGGYTRENIVPACGQCNSSKKANLPTQPLQLVLT